MNGHDEGKTLVYNISNFHDNNIQGYKAASFSDAGNIMISYSSINGIPMSINGFALQKVLQDELGFDGFLVSDYDIITRVEKQGAPTSFIKMSREVAFANIFNAGIDMFMVPTDIEEFFKLAKVCLQRRLIHEDRLNDAVKKILAVKFTLGLVRKIEAGVDTAERFLRSSSILLKPTAAEFVWQDALKAAQESLVLLKNENSVLPINIKEKKYVILVGERVVDKL